MPKQGEIILIPFPFTDLSSSKIRPALVVSKGLKGENIIVVFISSQLKERHSTDISVSPTKQNGLKAVSHIKCAKIATLDTSMIIGSIGTLSTTELAKVKASLKKLFS